MVIDNAPPLPSHFRFDPTPAETICIYCPIDGATVFVIITWTRLHEKPAAANWHIHEVLVVSSVKQRRHFYKKNDA